MATDNNKAIKELLEIINNKVGEIELRQSLQSTQIEIIKDQQSVMNEKLDDHSKKLTRLEEKADALSGDVEEVHEAIKGIRDKEGLYHSRNKREIDEIKTHLDMPLIPDTPQI